MKYANLKVSPNDIQSNEDNSQYNYKCFEDGCCVIPKILETHTESGKILLECAMHKDKKKEIDIDEYFKKLEKEKDIEPVEINDIDNDKKKKNQKKNIEKYINKINKKEGEIDDIILFDKNLIDAEENYPFNYYYKKNMINAGNYYEEENNRSYEEIKKIKEDLKSQENLNKIEKLKEEYGINLLNFYNNKKFKMKLKGEKMEKKLGNEGFKLISNIIFLNLIEINLSFHGITDVSPLENMLLPHLEILNMSNNQIENIKPIAELYSKRLREIFLNNNEIDNFEPFYFSDFPELEILRIDENKDSAYEKKKFAKVKKKYYKQIFYIKGDLTKFEKDFDIQFDDKSKELKLGSRRKGDILVKNLFPLIKYPNKIEYLYLDDNRLTDESTSLLIRMPLFNLKSLDLSLNFITNIKFVEKLFRKSIKLKTLYLNNNQISDISPLLILQNKNENEDDNEDENKNDNEDDNKDDNEDDNEDDDKDDNEDDDKDDNEDDNKEDRQEDNKDEKEKLAELEILSLKNNRLDLSDKKTFEILNMFIEKSGKKFDIDYEKEDIKKFNNNINKLNK